MVSVCHIVGGIVGGGVEQVIVNYCSKIKNVQFALLYQYNPDEACLSKLESAGIECVRIPEKGLHPIKHCLSIYSFLKKEKCDAVHVHLDWFQSWIICIIAYIAGVRKRIIHHHRFYQERTFVHRVIFFVMQRLNLFCSTNRLACSEDAAINGFGKNAYDNGFVKIIPNAVDIDHFKYDLKNRNDIRRQYGVNENICIGCVGRFSVEKNQIFLLDVLEHILKSRTDVCLMLIGNGPDKSMLENVVSQRNLKDKVVFVESQSDVSLFYSAMDVFCLPSKSEGFGMVLVEAQINGLRCFASNGVPKSVKISEGLNFLPINKSSVWADAILNADFSHDYFANATSFNINNCYKDLETIYLE